jgi:hypothetical protein
MSNRHLKTQPQIQTMKTKSKSPIASRDLLPLTLRMLLCALLTLAGLTAALKVQAASQTWTNAPVSGSWTNVLNWNSKAVPGALNSSTVADVATFTNALPISGIGGAGNPITNDLTRGVNGLVFDGANCGHMFSETVCWITGWKS